MLTCLAHGQCKLIKSKSTFGAPKFFSRQGLYALTNDLIYLTRECQGDPI